MRNRHISVQRTFGRTTAILILATFLIAGMIRAASWTEINAGLPGISLGVNSLTIDPASPSTIYATTVTNGLGNAVGPGLFKTTDGAESWKSVSSVNGVMCLVIDPKNPSTIYAGTNQGAVKSTNAGQSWTDVTNNLPAGAVTRLVIDHRLQHLPSTRSPAAPSRRPRADLFSCQSSRRRIAEIIGPRWIPVFHPTRISRCW